MATGGPGSGTTKPPRPKKKRAAAPRGDHAASTPGFRPTTGPLRPATPTVTEHTRGQANAIDRNSPPVPFQGREGPVGDPKHDPLAGPARSYIRNERLLLKLLATNLSAVQNPEQGQTKQAGLLDLGVAKNIGESYKHEVEHPLRHPLSTLLDLSALVSGGFGAVGRVGAAARGVKAAEEGEKGAAAMRALSTKAQPAEALPAWLMPDDTGHRYVRFEGGQVQVPHTSPNLLTAAAQHGFDRLSEAAPGLRGIGARDRVARLVTEENANRLRRKTAEVIPLTRAAKELRGRAGAQTPEQVAYTSIARYGHGEAGAKEVDLEIQQKSQALLRATGRTRKRLQNRIKLLTAARPLVVTPSEKLAKALAEGEPIAEATGASRVARGFVTEETQAAAKNRHIRIVHGAEHVKPTPAKAGKSTALDAAHARRDRLQVLYDRAVAKHGGAETEASRARTTDEAQARFDAIDKQYQALVDKVVPEVQPYVDARYEQLRRNRTKVRKGETRPQTVANEVRALAEQAIHEHAQKDPRIAALLAERERLQQALNPDLFEPVKASELGSVVTAKKSALSSPTVERLGAALSVQKDKVQQLEAAAARRVKPTGLVGAEDVKAGEGSFFTPDVEKQSSFAALKKPIQGSLNVQKEGRAKQSTGALFRQGREQVGPDVTAKDFLKEVRHMDRQARAKKALTFSRPLDPELFDPREHLLLDPSQARKLTKAENGLRTKIAATKRDLATGPVSEVELEQLSPAEQVKRVIAEHTAWAQKVFPTVDQANEGGLHGLRMIDRKVGEAIVGQNVMNSAKTNPLLSMLDFTNNLNRAALIYLNPAYIPVQGASNIMYLGLQQGVWAAPNIPRLTKRLFALPAATRDRVALEEGGGGAAALAHEGHGVLADPFGKLAAFQNAGADKIPRGIAWLYEAEKAGYETDAEIHALLAESKLEPTLNGITEKAQQAMVKFQRSPTGFRRTVRRAIFIAPWIEGSTRYLGRLALDHPINAAVANNIRQHIYDRQVKKLGLGKLATGSFIPVGNPIEKYGQKVIPGYNPASVSVTGTGNEVLNAGREFLPKQLGGIGATAHGGSRVLDLAQPGLKALFEAGTRIDLYHGRSYPSSMSRMDILQRDTIGTADRPAFPLGSIVATGLRKAPTNLEGRSGEGLPLYVPEHGWRAALRRAGVPGIPEHGYTPDVSEIPVGSTRKRYIFAAAAQAQGREAARAKMSPARRIVEQYQHEASSLLTDGVKYGAYKPGTKALPAPVQQAYRLRTRRWVAYAQAGLKKPPRGASDDEKLTYQRAGLTLDVKLARQLGEITPQIAGSELEWAKTAALQDLTNERRTYSAQFFGGDTIAAEHEAVNSHKAA